jgi:hypothetical protein
VAGFCECGDDPSVSRATDLVSRSRVINVLVSYGGSTVLKFSADTGYTESVCGFSQPLQANA